VGFDPFIGYYHQPRFGLPALALDLMEPFRPLVADSAVLSAINTGMVTTRDFVRVGPSVALTAGGRKGFFRAYELRMDTLVSHPLFEYRVTYRRLLEIQACWRACWTGRLRSIQCSSHVRGMSSGLVASETQELLAGDLRVGYE
jgi:CRISPR-associated endonuclease Cas1